MLNLIQADLFKLYKSQAIKLLFAITSLSALAMTVIAYLIPQGKISGQMIGIGFMFSDINMISILGAVIASILICSDFEYKTIHNAISSGNSRAAIISSKAITSSIALLFILLPYVIVTVIALNMNSEFEMGSVALGFLHLLTFDGNFSSEMTLKLVLVIITLLTVYVAQLSICIPLAFLLRKPLFVIIIYYGISIMSAQLMSFSERSPSFERFYSSTPYGGSHIFTTFDTGAGDLAKSMIVSLLFIVIMVAITYGVFRKAEIK